MELGSNLRNFKIVMTGYNCYEFMEASLTSVLSQNYPHFDVCVVDDASTDLRQPERIEQLRQQFGFEYIQHTQNTGALVSQWEAILALNPQDGDVVVWVDLDDCLAHPNVLSVLDTYYDSDTYMTYGSYASMPHSRTCSPANRYPVQCEQQNGYRDIHTYGLQFNHLRTVTWDLLKHLDPQVDFIMNGQWMELSADAAIMLPCLELSGGKYKCIKEILYHYSSDNPLSEWRKAPQRTNVLHDYVANLPRKKPVV